MKDYEQLITIFLARIADLEKFVQHQVARIAKLEKRLNKNSSNSLDLNIDALSYFVALNL